MGDIKFICPRCKGTVVFKDVNPNQRFGLLRCPFGCWMVPGKSSQPKKNSGG